MRVLLLSIVMCCSVLNMSSTVAADYSDPIEYSGDKMMFGLNLAALGATLFYEEGYEGVLQFVETTVVTQVATEGLKSATGKERPNGNCCKSFPSGHASGAFSAAAFIHFRYGWEFGIPAYLGASYTAYSRVQAKKHYWEDVMAGAALGIAISYYFTDPYDSMNIQPIISDDIFGINISGRW